jgi:predicted transcriptional regulator
MIIYPIIKTSNKNSTWYYDTIVLAYMAKFKEKYEAEKLRKQGFSIKDIAKELKVSSSSVSLWVRDIILSSEQYRDLENHKRDPYYGRRLDYLNKIKSETDKKVERLKREGIKEVGTLSSRELFLIGVALYWSEGFKKDSQVGFSNSDPSMINIFIKWLKEYFGYAVDDLIPRVAVNISHKNRIDKIQKHWSMVIGIPIENFQKPYYQNFKWKKVYNNPNSYFGILRIRVRKSKDFLRKIHGYIDGLRLQAGWDKIVDVPA